MGRATHRLVVLLAAVVAIVMTLGGMSGGDERHRLLRI